MPSRLVTWSLSCKSPNRVLILALQRWLAILEEVVEEVAAVTDVVVTVEVGVVSPLPMRHLSVEAAGKPVDTKSLQAP